MLGTEANKIFKVIRGQDKATAVPVTVETGMEIGSWVQVTGNIDENDEVVIIGNERLRAGSEIIVSRQVNDELDD